MKSSIKITFFLFLALVISGMYFSDSSQEFALYFGAGIALQIGLAIYYGRIINDSSSISESRKNDYNSNALMFGFLGMWYWIKESEKREAKQNNSNS